MICYDRKIIFIHIPKCGGTSVEDLLWPNPDQRTERNLWMGVKYPFWRPIRNKYQTGGLQHLTADNVRKHVGDKTFNSFYKFAFVRHPVSRLISQFKYLQKRDDLKRLLKIKGEVSFTDYLDRISEIEHVQWLPQASFLLDPDGKQIVDDIFKLEDLNDHVLELTERTGTDFSLLQRKNTTSDISSPEVSRADLKKIEEMHHTDFMLLEYS